MTQRDLQRWSREVAEDPGAPSFVRLARAYRKQGRPGPARDVVLAGLQSNPEHVEAHALLALLYVEEGDRQQARDEWETALRLDPDNFDASRGLGFLALERGDLRAARRHLDNAGRARPDDPAVDQALQVLGQRENGAVEPGAGASVAGVPAAAAGATTGGVGSAGGRVDPSRLFQPLEGEPLLRGALLLDQQGLVVAGRLEPGETEPELLAGMLATVVEEAHRTAELMDLGAWEGMLLDCDGVTLHVSPVQSLVLVLAARAETPAGWMVRIAAEAAALAHSFAKSTRG